MVNEKCFVCFHFEATESFPAKPGTDRNVCPTLESFPAHRAASCATRANRGLRLLPKDQACAEFLSPAECRRDVGCAQALRMNLCRKECRSLLPFAALADSDRHSGWANNPPGY